MDKSDNDTKKETIQFEPSGMTCYIMVDDSLSVNNIDRLKESCMGTLIDQWVLVGKTKPIGGYDTAATLQSAITLQYNKNKWAIIMYPNEILTGEISKLLVWIYKQADFKICSIGVHNYNKDNKFIGNAKSVRLFKRDVNPCKMFEYDFEHFITAQPAYIKKTISSKTPDFNHGDTENKKS